jgi:hypothetical protein
VLVDEQQGFHCPAHVAATSGYDLINGGVGVAGDVVCHGIPSDWGRTKLLQVLRKRSDFHAIHNMEPNERIVVAGLTHFGPERILPNACAGLWKTHQQAARAPASGLPEQIEHENPGRQSQGGLPSAEFILGVRHWPINRQARRLRYRQQQERDANRERDRNPAATRHVISSIREIGYLMSGMRGDRIFAARILGALCLAPPVHAKRVRSPSP